MNTSYKKEIGIALLRQLGSADSSNKIKWQSLIVQGVILSAMSYMNLWHYSNWRPLWASITKCLHVHIKAKKPEITWIWWNFSYFNMRSESRRLATLFSTRTYLQYTCPSDIYHITGRGSEYIYIYTKSNGICLVIQAIYRWPKSNF